MFDTTFIVLQNKHNQLNISLVLVFDNQKKLQLSLKYLFSNFLH